MKKRKSTKFIPSKLYRKIIKLLPIACVDLVVCRGNKFLLTKRINQPAKNQWWLLGGRIFKNETFSQTIKRKVQEEACLTLIKKIQFLGCDSTKFETGLFGDPTHTVNFVFKVKVGQANRSQSGADGPLKWFDKINENWPEYVKKFLKLANYK